MTGRPLRTIWYALDEPVADTVRRFQALGADPERVIINDAPRTFSEFLDAVQVDLKAFPGVGLIVLDTLSRLMSASGIDANSSHEVEPAIVGLVDFFHRHNVAGILLYHTGKAGREYRGSTALGATVDEVLTLRRRGQAEEDDFDADDSDDGRRLLMQDGRNLRGRLHLTCVNGVYQKYDDAFPPREKILNALRDHGAVIGRSELCKLAGVRKGSGLEAITDLIAGGSVVERGRELKLAIPTVAGSHRFPEGGTTAEPTREPLYLTPQDAGSRFCTGGEQETGTSAAAPVIHNPTHAEKPQVKLAV